MFDVEAGETLGQARLHECLGHVGVGESWSWVIQQATILRGKSGSAIPISSLCSTADKR
jgi:hypothetical protein